MGIEIVNMDSEIMKVFFYVLHMAHIDVQFYYYIYLAPLELSGSVCIGALFMWFYAVFWKYILILIDVVIF